MPALPALTVSQAHYDRIVTAFPGDTLGEKAASYQAWNINALIDEVSRLEGERLVVVNDERRAELMALLNGAEAQRETSLAALRASLPAKVKYPPK